MKARDKELDRLFEKMQWYAPVPPVCTANWDARAWIRWVDKHGRWLPVTQKRT